LIAVLLVADRKPLLFPSALTIERMCWVTCVVGFTSKISRSLGITVDSVLTDISASSTLTARRSASLPPLESGRPCPQLLLPLCPSLMPNSLVLASFPFAFFLFMLPFHQSPSQT
jgi:hypothetical protein